MMLQSASVSPPQHDRFMTRTRRIASSLRDSAQRRRASCRTPWSCSTSNQHVRWFNHAAEESARPAPAAGSRRTFADRLAQLGFVRLAARRHARTAQRRDRAGPSGQPRSTSACCRSAAASTCCWPRDISHLTRLEQIRRDFVANVSHELRTPLTVIHGYLELLDPEDVPELAPVLDEMRTQSKRMGQIVEDLLTLSRLETQHQIADERVQMAPLLATVRKEAEALSQGRHTDHARVHRRGRSARLAEGSAQRAVEPGQQRRALHTYRRQHRHPLAAHVRRRRRDSRCRIPASAFPPRICARLTERFYRISSSRSRDTGGTGLGFDRQARAQPASGPTADRERRLARARRSPAVFGQATACCARLAGSDGCTNQAAASPWPAPWARMNHATIACLRVSP